MACSVVAVLAAHHRIDQDALARSFAEHHDFDRGYGPAVNRLLRLVREGGDWRELAAALFNGQGSWGNGAAMRVAPLGAWYADDPEQATHQAEISAYPTHQHREAVVGAMAVAAAAALAADPGGPAEPPRRCWTASSRCAAQRRRRRAAARPGHARLRRRGHRRGRARLRTAHVSAHDTVPFALWSAARALGDYEAAFWTTAQVGGDVDTTCAIVGGVSPAGRRERRPPPGWTPRRRCRNGCPGSRPEVAQAPRRAYGRGSRAPWATECAGGVRGRGRRAQRGRWAVSQACYSPAAPP